MASTQPRARKTSNLVWSPVLVCIVIPDVGTPLFPGLGFRRRLALFPWTGKANNLVWSPVLVGVVIPNIGSPLFPGLGFRRWLALFPGTRQARDVIWVSVLVGVVIPDVGTPLLPGLGFRRRLALLPGMRKVGNAVWSSVLIGVVISDVVTPLGPAYRRRGRLDGDDVGVEDHWENPLSGSGAGERATGMVKALTETAPMTMEVRATLENMTIIYQRIGNNGTGPRVGEVGERNWGELLSG